jgi:hypothetical protein
MDSRYSAYLHGKRHLVNLIDKNWINQKLPSDDIQVQPADQPPTQEDLDETETNKETNPWTELL